MADLGTLEYELDIQDEKFNKKLKENNEKLAAMSKTWDKLTNINMDKSTKSAINHQKVLLAQSKTITQQIVNRDRLNRAQSVTARTATAAAQAQTTANNRNLIELQKLEKATIATNVARQKANNIAKNNINTINRTSEAYQKQGLYLQNLKTLASSYLSIFAAVRIIDKVRDITGEFELQNKALAAIIQNKDRADQMFQEVTELALKSPFAIKELLTYTKSLAAYRIETESLIPTLTKLADVSAGLGVDMQRMILAYGQVKAASVLRGQELRQFTEAGIPLVSLLADKFSELEGRVVSTSDVFDKISKRMVSFGMVSEIFEDMTEKGGIFFEAQRVQAETVAGMWNILIDATDKMFNAIGSQNLDSIKDAISLATDMTREWETFVSVLKVAVTTYGVLKVSTLLYSKAILKQRINLAIASAGTKEAALSQGLLTQAQLAAIPASTRLGLSFKRLGLSMKAMLVGNPIGLIVTAITALGYALYESSENSKQAKEEFEESLKPLLKQADSLNNIKIKLEDVNLSEAERIKLMKEAAKASNDEISANEKRAESLVKLNTLSKVKSAAVSIKEGEFDSEINISKIKENIAEVQSEVDKASRRIESSYLIFRNNIGKINFSDEIKNQLEAVSVDIKKYPETIDRALASSEVIWSRISYLRSEKQKITGEYTKDASEYRKAINKEVDELLKLSESLNETNISLFKGGLRESDIGIFNENTGIIKKETGELNKILAERTEKIKEWAKEISIQTGVSVNSIETLIKKALGMATEVITPEINLNDFQRTVENTREEFIKLKDIDFDNFGKELIPKDETSVTAWFKLVADGYKTLKQTAIDAEKKEEAINKSRIERTEAERLSSKQSIKDAKDKRDLYKEYIDLFNIPLNKNSGSVDNEAVNNLKAQVALLKSIKKSREELSKTLTTDKVKSSIEKLYSGQAKDLGIEIPITSDASAFYEQLQGIADKAKVLGTKAGRLLSKAINKSIAELQVGDISKQAKTALKELEKEVKQYKNRFSFYRDMLGITGDEEIAIKLGLDENESNNFVETIKKLIVDKFGKDYLVSIDDVIDYDSSFEKLKNNIDKFGTDTAKSINKLLKVVDNEANKSLIDRLKLQYSEFAEGIGIEFDFSNVVTKLNKDVKKAKLDLENALKDTSATETDKAQIEEITKINIASISEIARQRVEKMGGAYIKERLEIEGLGAAYSNMTNASLEDVNKIIEAIEKSKQGLLSGEGLVSIFEKSGLSENITSNLFSDLKDSSDIDDFLSKLKDVKDATKDVSNLKIGDEVIDSETSGEISTLIQLLETLAKSLKNTGDSAERMKLNKQIKNWKSLQNEINGLLDVVKTLGDEMGVGLTDSGKKAITAIQTTATGIMSVISNTSKLAAAELSAVEKASVILAIISAALQVMNEVNNLIEKFDDSGIEAAKERTKEVSKQIRMEATINAIYRERNKLQGESLTLGLTYGQQVSEALKLAENGSEDLDSAIKALQENAIFSDREYWRNLWGWGVKKSKRFDFSFEDIFGGIVPDGNSIGANLFTAILDRLDIFGNTQKGKAQQKAFKKITEDMKNAFAELEKQGVDAANMTNAEWLTFFEVMKEAGTITDDATLSLIENAKTALEEMEQQMEKVREIITSITDQIGADLGDALADSFVRGEDGALAFKSTVEDVLEELLKQKIMNKLFASDFGKLEEEMEASMGADGDKNWVDDITRFFNSTKDKVDEANEAFEKYKEWGKTQGLDIFAPDTDELKGLSKGIASIKEDTARRLEAYINSIREEMFKHSGNHGRMLQSMSRLESINTNSLTHIATIDSNVAIMMNDLKSVITQSTTGNAIRTKME